MPKTAFRKSRCLNASDSIRDLFKWVCESADRNDKEDGKLLIIALVVYIAVQASLH